MGIDLGGQLIVGIDISKCVHHETGKSLKDIIIARILESEEGDEDDVLEYIQDNKFLQNELGLDGFAAYDGYGEFECDGPVFVGMELCSCGNRGEPLSGSCTPEDIHEVVDTVVTSLAAKGFRGPISVAFVLGAS